MIPMLNAVGINAKLRTPEWATLWADVQKGKTPFYYMGRGSVVDPSPALSQYFETGGSPRIGISDPQIDKTLAAERVTFDPAERKKALNARSRRSRTRRRRASCGVTRCCTARPKTSCIRSTRRARLRHKDRRQAIAPVPEGMPFARIKVRVQRC